MRFLKRLILFLLIAGIAYGIWWFVAEQHRQEVAQLRYDTYGREQGGPIAKEHVNPADLAEGNDGSRPNKTELLFLLAGVDEDGSEGTRTDTLILIKVNWLDGTTQLLSIPRDSYAYIGDSPDKINHAHAFGGMQLTLQSVRELLGIDVDYYVKMDMDAVIEIVDIIGGISYEVEEPQASDLGLDTGVQTLDGMQTLEYIRYRKGFSDGDLGRVSSQQTFLKAMLPQILSPKNLIHLPTLLAAAHKYSDTNLSPFTIAAMTPAVFTARSNLTAATLPGEAGELDGISYYFLYEEALQALVDEYLPRYKTADVLIP